MRLLKDKWDTGVKSERGAVVDDGVTFELSHGNSRTKGGMEGTLLGLEPGGR